MDGEPEELEGENERRLGLETRLQRRGEEIDFVFVVRGTSHVSSMVRGDTEMTSAKFSENLPLPPTHTLTVTQLISTFVCF